MAAFVNEYWLLLGILLTMATTIGGGLHQYVIMPQIDSHFESIAEDELKDWLKHHGKQYVDSIVKPSSFRGKFEKVTGVDKALVTDSLGILYLNEKSVYNSIESLLAWREYQKGYNELISKQVFGDTIEGGVAYKTSEKYINEWYYPDSLNHYWQSFKIFSEGGARFYYPPYNNNNRTKCKSF